MHYVDQAVAVLQIHTEPYIKVLIRLVVPFVLVFRISEGAHTYYILIAMSRTSRYPLLWMSIFCIDEPLQHRVSCDRSQWDTGADRIPNTLEITSICHWLCTYVNLKNTHARLPTVFAIFIQSCLGMPNTDHSHSWLKHACEQHPFSNHRLSLWRDPSRTAHRSLLWSYPLQNSYNALLKLIRITQFHFLVLILFNIKKAVIALSLSIVLSL